MLSLLRTAKPWTYGVVVFAIVLASLCGYLYHRHTRIKALIEALKSSEPEVAQAAAKSLGEMGSDIVPYLIPLIKEMNSQTRAHTADALRNVGSAVPSLVELLKDKDVEMQVASVEILGKIGPAAKDSVPALIEILKDLNENESVRQTVVVALGEIKDPRAINPLLETFKRHGRRNTSADALTEDVLVKIGSDAIQLLIAALENNDAPVVREASARVLGKMGNAAKSSVPALIKVLRNLKESESLRQTVAIALGDIKDPFAIDPLIELFYRDLSSDNPAPVALGKIGGEAVAPLLKTLEDKKDKIREFSAYSLGEIGPAAKGAVPALIAKLKDPVAEVRGRVIWALGKIGDKEAVKPLMELLRQKYPLNSVIVALGDIGSEAKEAAPLLEVLSWEDNLHSDAIIAWKKLSPESMNDILYNEQRYAYIKDAFSGVVLLTPMKGEILSGTVEYPEWVTMTFKWIRRIRTDEKPEIDFCSIVTLDTGTDPFDGGLGGIQDYAGGKTEVKLKMNYPTYFTSGFEWGVRVIACRDRGKGCDKRGECLGRTLKSPVGTYGK